MSNEKVYWLINSKTDITYKSTTWYRCLDGEDFVKLVEKKDKIVGIIFSGDNIGFILDERPRDKK